MSDNNIGVQTALAHVRYLSEMIGGRGSCTPSERLAAEYAADQMRALGLVDVRLEPYAGAPSTYRPYVLAFGAALLGTLGAWLIPGRGMLAAAALLNACGAWGMLAESDFAASWMSWLLPKAPSQNAVGIIPASGSVRQRVVLCAHLDTHRTPVFYASPTWQALFSLLVSAAFVSMLAGGLVYGIGAIFGGQWSRWVGLLAAAVQAFAIGLCLHADFTPFSPGANDDASGVGVILELAVGLQRAPLSHTEVWLAFTGCEESASYGMRAFLEAHANQLGATAVYIILDEVGLSRFKVMTSDGLILRHQTHPQALALARRAAAAQPELAVREQTGRAYTDALVATRRGLVALTLSADPDPARGEVSRWHQIADTVAHLQVQALANASAFTRQLLAEIEAGEADQA
jgi:hypothetical protein